MKHLKITVLALATFFFFTCSDDDDSIDLQAVESEQIRNLAAPQIGGQGQGEISGEFTKFSFASGQQTNSNTEWDIAFRGTSIIVNGGTSQGSTDEPERTGNAAAYIAESTFANVTTVDASLLAQDNLESLAIPAGSDNGWYNYNFMANLITPLAGKVLVFRTADGQRYAKMEILSYYKDAPANPDGFNDESRYYTFNYVYQPNGGVNSFD